MLVHGDDDGRHDNGKGLGVTHGFIKLTGMEHRVAQCDRDRVHVVEEKLPTGGHSEGLRGCPGNYGRATAHRPSTTRSARIDQDDHSTFSIFPRIDQ